MILPSVEEELERLLIAQGFERLLIAQGYFIATDWNVGAPAQPAPDFDRDLDLLGASLTELQAFR